MTKKINVTTTLAAAAVGIAAGAAAVGLSDKNNRKKLGKIVANVSDRANQFAKDANKNQMVKNMKSMGENLLTDASKKAKPVARRSVKKVANHVDEKLK